MNGLVGMSLNFDWDERKAATNLRKHGVDFEEAIGAFDDVHSIDIFDENHSVTEERFIKIGTSYTGRLLVVIYSLREEVIRIFSCREATSEERKYYER